MAIETINLGTSPNDRTGDDLRTAFGKVNDNFAQVSTASANASSLTAGTLADARLTLLAQSAAKRTATLHVDAALGNDATAVRGTTLPYATLAVAMAAAQDNDTIRIGPGSYAAANHVSSNTLHFVGAGKLSTTVVPPDQCQWQLGPGSTVQAITFDTGTLPGPNDSSTGFLCLLGANYRISDCVFRNLKSPCLYGIAVTQSNFERLYFDHVAQAGIFDSLSASQVPGNLRFTDIEINTPQSAGLQVHCKDGDQQYTSGSTIGAGASISGRQAPGLSNGLWFTRCRAYGGTNALIGFEVWHGWRNVHFTDCAADGFGFNFTVAFCGDVTLVNCRSSNSTFAIEYSDSWNMHAIGCIVTNGAAGCNGTAHDNSFESGTVINGTVSLYGSGGNGATFGASSWKVVNNFLLGSALIVQHGNDVLISGNTFKPAPDGTTTSSWIALNAAPGPIDNGGVPALNNVTIQNNKFFGGTSNGPGIVGTGTGSYSSVRVKDNETDGVYNNYGGYWDMNGMTVNATFSGNITASPNFTYPTNTNFPNDPPGVAYDDTAAGGIPANNEVTGSNQLVVISPQYWFQLYDLSSTTTTATGTSTSYLVAAGDYLEYDIWNDIANPETRWGVDGNLSDGVRLINDTGGLVDQNGINYNQPTAPYSTARWYHRRIYIGAAAGKTVNSWAFNVGAGGYGGAGNGSCTVYFRRILVTNSGGLKAFVTVNDISGVEAAAPGSSYTFTPLYQTLSTAQRTTLTSLVDSGGYLHTGTQPYAAGAVAPTGYLVLKDSNGVAYQVPAVAAT